MSEASEPQWTIRAERGEDAPLVEALNQTAFGPGRFAKSAYRLREGVSQVGELASDPRVRWIGIASGLWADRTDLRDYRSQYKVTIPITLDANGKIFRSFRVNDVPTILIADAQGRLVRRIEGGAMQDTKALRTALEGL